MATQITPEEEWRQIIGYRNLYSISSLGKVRRDRTHTGLKISRILRQTIDKKTGYPNVTLSIDGIQKVVSIHRIMAKNFIDLINIKLEINHIDGDKTNNNLLNLEFVNHSQN